MHFIKKEGKEDESNRLDLAGKGKTRQKESEFKGVRMRKWGKWVSEIRVPRSRDRIWLGSYDTPEKAARAYDAALYCLRGSHCRFNFPAEKRPEISSELSVSEIKAIAARFASPDSGRFGVFEEIVEGDCPSSTFSTRASSPEILFCRIQENLPEMGDSLVGGLESGGVSLERFLVDDPVLPELDNFWEF